MSYVQTPSSSWFSQACEPDASGVVSGAMREALMRVEPNSMPSTAPPDRMDSTALAGCRFTDSSPADSLLPVVGVLPVLALEVLADQTLWERRRRGREGSGHERHPRQLLQHGCVVHGLLRRLAPG